MRRQAGGVANSLVSKLLLKEARCEDLADQQYYREWGVADVPGWLRRRTLFKPRHKRASLLTLLALGRWVPTNCCRCLELRGGADYS